jgi:hypothetical protein
MAQQRLFAYKPRCSLRYPGKTERRPPLLSALHYSYIVILPQVHVISLNGLLFIEMLDWERVKKLGGKFLQLRLLEDIVACRYPDT